MKNGMRTVLLAMLAFVVIAAGSGCYYDVEEELYPPSVNGGCDTTGYAALTYQNGIKPIFDTYGHPAQGERRQHHAACHRRQGHAARGHAGLRPCETEGLAGCRCP